jgi:tripeptidyl-peptidase-1
MKGSLLLLSGLLAGVLASPVTHDHVVHEKRDIAHPRWYKRSPLDGDTNIPVRIALKQRNLDRGMDFLMEVYVSTRPQPRIRNKKKESH